MELVACARPDIIPRYIMQRRLDNSNYRLRRKCSGVPEAHNQTHPLARMLTYKYTYTHTHIYARTHTRTTHACIIYVRTHYISTRTQSAAWWRTWNLACSWCVSRVNFQRIEFPGYHREIRGKIWSYRRISGSAVHRRRKVSCGTGRYCWYLRLYWKLSKDH